MQTTIHAKAAPRRGRAVGLALALLLQAGFVYALVAGLNIKNVISTISGPIIATIEPAKKTPPQPVNVRDTQPDTSKPVMPDVVIDYGQPPQDPPWTFTKPGTGGGPADHGPVSVPATHTIPPYPPIEARLGHEGTVMLRLTISPTGQVIDAAVVRSSGYERLDQAARDWVIAHWRYQPAMRGGAAIPSSGNVTVTFNLRNAG